MVISTSGIRATGPLDVLVHKAISKEVADEQSDRAVQLLTSIIASTPPIRKSLKADLEASLYAGDNSTRYSNVEKLIATIDDAESARMGLFENPAEAPGGGPSLFKTGVAGPPNETFLRHQVECEVKSRQVAQEWCQSLEAEISKLRWRLDAEQRLRSGLEGAKTRLVSEAEELKSTIEEDGRVAMALRQQIVELRQELHVEQHRRATEERRAEAERERAERADAEATRLREQAQQALAARDREAEAASALRMEASSVERRLQAAQTEAEAAGSLKEHLERHYASMRATVDAEAEVGGKMREQLEQLRGQAAALLAERPALRASVDRLRGELEAESSARTKAERALADSRAEASKLRSQLAAAEGELRALRASYHEAAEGLSKATGELASLQRQNAASVKGMAQLRVEAEAAAQASEAALREATGRAERLARQRSTALRRWGETQRAFTLHCTAAFAFRGWRDAARRAAAAERRVREALARSARRRLAAAFAALRVQGAARADRRRLTAVVARAQERRRLADALRAMRAVFAEERAERQICGTFGRRRGRALVRAAFGAWRAETAALARRARLAARLAARSREHVARGVLVRWREATRSWRLRHDAELAAAVAAVRDEVEALRRQELARVADQALGAQVAQVVTFRRKARAFRAWAQAAQAGGWHGALLRLARRMEPARLQALVCELQMQATGKSVEELFEAEFADEPRLVGLRAAHRRATYREELRAALEARARERQALDAAEAQREQLHAMLAEAVKARAKEAEAQRRHLEGVEAQVATLRKQVVPGPVAPSPGRPSPEVAAAIPVAASPVPKWRR